MWQESTTKIQVRIDPEDLRAILRAIRLARSRSPQEIVNAAIMLRDNGMAELADVIQYRGRIALLIPRGEEHDCTRDDTPPGA